MRFFPALSKPKQPTTWTVVEIVQSGIGPFGVTRVTGSRSECERMATRLQVMNGGNFQVARR